MKYDGVEFSNVPEVGFVIGDVAVADGAFGVGEGPVPESELVIVVLELGVVEQDRLGRGTIKNIVLRRTRIVLEGKNGQLYEYVRGI